MQTRIKFSNLTFKNIIESPTLMTWGSFMSRSLSLIVILPLTLNRLDTAEITVWFLFSTILTLQNLVDLGFTPTFTRIFAYGMSGTSIEDLEKENKNGNGEPNWNTIRSTISTVNYIFLRLGMIWFIGLLFIGSFSVNRQIQFLSFKMEGWIAWSIIVCCSFFIIRGNKYVAILQGLNEVALLRRWEMLTSLGASISMIIAILVWKNLIAIVAAHQIWQLINVIRNKLLIEKLNYQEIKNQNISKKVREVFQAVWVSAIRSGLGILMSYGLIQFSGIYFAQVHNNIETAKFLFALRLIQTIVQFSQAPFYSKIPMFSLFYASNKKDELVNTLQRSMFLSYISYVIPFVFLFFFGDYFLKIVHSQITFPDKMMWLLFGIAYFVERFGAMHIQIYSLTNKIIWHIANGISGLIFIILIILLENYFTIYTIAISLLFSNLLFYSWFSSVHSYKIIQKNFFIFESKTSIIPFAIIISLFVFAILL